MLNPPYRSNLATPRRGNLGTLAAPLPCGTITAWATGGIGTNNGPQQAGYDQNVSTGVLTAGLNHVGIYTALIAASPAITACKATLTDTAGTFFDLLDLATGLDPLDLPAGILSALQLTNAIIFDGIFGFIETGTFGTILLYQHATPVNGWRVIFDSALILGSQLSFTPSINLVHAQLGTQLAGQAIFQSHWNYLPNNPRLAQTDTGIKWFYDAGQPAVNAWQLWASSGAGGNQTLVNTYPAATLTASGLTSGLYWIIGVDASANPITPPSNGLST